MQLANSSLYILLPVYNRKKVTLEFVSSLKKQSFSDYQLILIDDGSTDGTSDAVCLQIPKTYVIRGDGNLWWAGSLQKGIDALKEIKANSDSIVLIINDDTHIPEDFLEKGESYIRTSKNTIFCAQSSSQQTGKLLDTGVHIDWFKYQYNSAKIESDINCLSTRGLFQRFSDVVAIGEFMPNFLPHYYSDYEYTIRARRKGYLLRCPSDLKLMMNEATTGTHTADNLSVREYLKKSFQIRSAINPWTALKFITVAAPIIYKPICYFRLGVYFMKCLVKSLRNGI
jgi:GT2 family glycosyltransferase